MAKRVQLSGSSITGVPGAQHGAQKNAAAMNRAAGKAGAANYEFSSALGAPGAMGTAGAAGMTSSAASANYEFGSSLGANTAQLTGTSITGVSGAQHGAKKNAQAMQRAAQKAGK